LRFERFFISLGFDWLDAKKFLGLLLGGFLTLVILLHGLTGSIPITLSIVFCLSVQVWDSLRTRARNQLEKQSEHWPKFLDAIHSACWAGVSLEQAVLDCINFAPKGSIWAFTEFEKDLSSGMGFDLAMVNLKSRLASPIADRFVELTRLANQSGGRGYLEALRAQSVQLRTENATWAEINAKQNWVISSAKLAVFAPWLILLLLSIRPETAQTFNSDTGAVVLVLGLVASLLAFQLTRYLGALPKRARVLAG